MWKITFCMLSSRKSENNLFWPITYGLLELFWIFGNFKNHKTEFETYILDSSRGWTILVASGSKWSKRVYHGNPVVSWKYILWLFLWFLSKTTIFDECLPFSTEKFWTLHGIEITRMFQELNSVMEHHWFWRKKHQSDIKIPKNDLIWPFYDPSLTNFEAMAWKWHKNVMIISWSFT